MPAGDPSAALTRRRWVRRVIITAGVAVVGVVVADHLGAFGYRGDDRRRFDRQRATVGGVENDGTVVIRTKGGGGDARVRLIGVEVGAGAVGFLRGYLDRDVLVRLETLEPRDEDGRLRAYLCLTDEVLLNAEVVREGYATADRRGKHSMAGVIDAAEAEAKRRKRGVWRVVAATTRTSS